VNRRAEFYPLDLASVPAALRMRRVGFSIAHFSLSAVMRALLQVPGQRILFARLAVATLFERTISEYEGAFYLVQHRAVDLPQRYYEAAWGMPSNPRLEKRARRLLGPARMAFKASGETAHEFEETRYAAKNWSHKCHLLFPKYKG
jgi:hypothetical protein